MDEYVQSEIASDEEDQKRIHRAQARASRKVKADRGQKTRTRWTSYRGSRFNHPVTPVATVTSQTLHQQHAPQQGRLGTCFSCGRGGHLRFECPNAKTNIKLSILDNYVSGICLKGGWSENDTQVSSVQQNVGEYRKESLQIGKCFRKQLSHKIFMVRSLKILLIYHLITD